MKLRNTLLLFALVAVSSIAGSPGQSLAEDAVSESQPLALEEPGAEPEVVDLAEHALVRASTRPTRQRRREQGGRRQGGKG